MKLGFLFFFLLIQNIHLCAQDSTVVIIKTGNRISDVLSTKDIFLYPEYKTGIVVFRDGTKAAALMNYNSLFDQMLFIDLKGDTLALEEEKTIQSIALEQDTFYYTGGYIRVIGGNFSLKLAEKRVWELADIQKIGSHERPARTFSVTSYRTLTDGVGRTLDLALAEDLVLRKNVYYYIGDRHNNFVPAGKKSLPLYAKDSDLLAKYLKDEKIDFRKKEDLEKLLLFLGQN